MKLVLWGQGTIPDRSLVRSLSLAQTAFAKRLAKFATPSGVMKVQQTRVSLTVAYDQMPTMISPPGIFRWPPARFRLRTRTGLLSSG